EAGRGARHMAREPFPLADPHLLVRIVVGRHRRDSRSGVDRFRDPGGELRLADLSRRQGVAVSQRQKTDVFVSAAALSVLQDLSADRMNKMNNNRIFRVLSSYRLNFSGCRPT